MLREWLLYRKGDKVKYIATKRFKNINIDFHEEEGKLWIKRRDLGEALDYSCPKDSTAKLHSRYKGLFNPHSKHVSLEDPNKRKQQTVLYNSTAVTRFCCISQQRTEKFLDWYYYTKARLAVNVA